jgi:Peptidase family M28
MFKVKKYVVNFGAALFSLAVNSLSGSCNHLPAIKNAVTTFDTVGKIVTIRYDLADDDNIKIKVDLRVSNDGGLSFQSGPGAMGDIGFPVSPGRGKIIRWNYSSINFNKERSLMLLVADELYGPDLKELLDQVDKTRLIQSLKEICGPRNLKDKQSSEHKAKVKTFLEGSFIKDGLSSFRQTFEYKGDTGQNVIGQLTGKSKQEIFLIGAHFDTVDDSPGCDDNGSGLIVLLELARILSKYDVETPITFAAFDFEEKGDIGSKVFVNRAGNQEEKIKGALICDMVGYFSEKRNSQSLPPGMDQLFPDQYKVVAGNGFKGDFLLSIANDNSKGLSLLFDSSSKRYGKDLKTISLVVPGNGETVPDLRRSDHASFWDAGIKGLYLGDGANTRNINYHSRTDTQVTVDIQKISSVVQVMLVFLMTNNHLRRHSVAFLGQFRKPFAK